MWRFGVFALDVRTGELNKGAPRVRVPDQSIQILTALLDAPAIQHRLVGLQPLADGRDTRYAAVRFLSFLERIWTSRPSFNSTARYPSNFAS